MAERKVIHKGNIGNALHSVAPDHIATTAEEIFDEKRQEYQQDINEGVGRYEENIEFIRVYLDNERRVLWGIQKDGNIVFGAGVPSQIESAINGLKNEINKLIFSGYLYVGVATIETNPGIPQAKVFYIITQKGTYPNFHIGEVQEEDEGLVIEKFGLYLVKWDTETSTWNLDIIQVIDDKPIKNSSNLVISGGVYEEIDNKDYRNVVKNDGLHTEMVVVANSNWERIKKQTANLYDPTYTYQVNEICNLSGEYLKDYSYKSLVSQKDNIPAHVEEQEIDQNQFTLEEALKVIPSEVKAKFKAGQIICFNNYEDNIEKWELQADGSWSKLNPYIIDNPEFLEVKFDAEKRILWGIQKDGNIIFGAGVPSQIKAELSQLEQELKNDIEQFKKKIEEELGYYIDNPEYSKLLLDNEKKILEGIKKEGLKYIPIPIETDSAIISTIQSLEYLKIETDLEGKIINAIRRDGDCIVGGVNINELKRNSDINTIHIEYDPETYAIYSIENQNSTITIEFNSQTGNIFAIFDDRTVSDVIMDKNGNIFAILK